MCLENDNIDLLEKLIDDVSLNRDPMLLHSLSTRILNVKYQGILRTLLNNDDPSAATMDVLDDNGLTPFLAYIEYFCSRYPSLRGDMMQLVNAEAQKHGTKFDKYKLDNQSLFEKKIDDGSHNRHNYGGGFGFNQPAWGQPAQFGNFGGGFGNPSSAPDAALDVVQKGVSPEKKAELTDQLMEKHVVVPFLECLNLLIEKGADCHAQV